MTAHPASGPAPIAVAFVGSVVPDTPAFQNGAFSRAGNMFQENLLVALTQAGMPPSIILTQRPWLSFPKSPELWLKTAYMTLRDGTPLKCVPFLNLPVIRPLAVGFSMLLQLLRWGWQNRRTPHKVVYTYNLTEPSGLFTLIGARLIGATAIASLNDVNVPGHLVPATLSRRLDFWIQKRIIPLFDGLVVVSKRIIEDFAPQTPFVLMEGGVEESVLASPAPSEQTGEGSHPFTIVSAGTLYEANGFVELLAAFAQLLGAHYRLVIAGAGPMEEQIRKAAAADPRIDFRGYVTFGQVLELYATADVLINMRPTQRLYTDYFFPSKLMEYLASGVPVISTCTGHVQEVFGELVYLLHDETAQGLARMIEHVASQPPAERTRKGRLARARIVERFTWTAQARRVAAFVQKLVVSPLRRHSFPELNGEEGRT